MRFPTRIHLPFGYVVKVRRVTSREMAKLAESVGGEGGLDGLWDDSRQTIYIRKTLSMKRQRYILWHELVHALADATHHCLNMETARP